MPNVQTSGEQEPNNPNYVELVEFLLQPLLDDSESLSIDCESSKADQKVWLRVAFDQEADKGKIFGRGGKNIQAIRTVLNTAATAAGQSVCLEVFSDRQKDRASGKRSESSQRQRSTRHASGSNNNGSRGRTRKKTIPRPNLDN